MFAGFNKVFHGQPNPSVTVLGDNNPLFIKTDEVLMLKLPNSLFDVSAPRPGVITPSHENWEKYYQLRTNPQKIGSTWTRYYDQALHYLHQVCNEAPRSRVAIGEMALLGCLMGRYDEVICFANKFKQIKSITSEEEQAIDEYIMSQGTTRCHVPKTTLKHIRNQFYEKLCLRIAHVKIIAEYHLCQDTELKKTLRELSEEDDYRKLFKILENISISNNPLKIQKIVKFAFSN